MFKIPLIRQFVFLCVTPVLVHAEMFKCMKDGAPIYQDTPCDKSAVEVKTAVTSDSYMGCFEAKVPFAGNGGAPTTKFMLKKTAGSYSFMNYNPNAMPAAIYTHASSVTVRGRTFVNSSQQIWTVSNGALLKTAPHDELVAMGKSFDITLDHGVSSGIPWNASAQNVRPVGLYFGTDKAGNKIMMASLQNGTGKAERIQCPTS